ncbi:MAG: hypothetical protein MI975_06045 [Cytophagales bacterium]|nr:hypothetical protein [Cytophagales bacterium]
MREEEMKDTAHPNEDCSGSACCCNDEAGNTYSKAPQQTPIVRRDFMKFLGLMTGGLVSGVSALGNTTDRHTDGYAVPEDKGLDPEWVKSLYKRGAPEIYSGKELAYIGMPVGGITAGQVYLGGDGKLWLWKIFNKQHNGVIDKTIRVKGRRIRARDGSNYVVPIDPASPFDQGFKIVVQDRGQTKEKMLDYTGFRDITFKGQYPIGEVRYRESGFPVEIDMTAYSPFIPLEWESSSYPATVIRYTIKNTTARKVTCKLEGWMENASQIATGDPLKTIIRNKLMRRDGDAIIAFDTPAELAENKSQVNDPELQRDYGSMALLLRNAGAACGYDLGNGQMADLGSNGETEYTSAFNHKSIGRLTKTVEIEAGGESTVEFIVAWYFPNLYPSEWRDLSNSFRGRHYRTMYTDAAAVAMDLASKFEYLHEHTLQWRKTFYEDASLPHWFLNRTFVNTSTLATETCYRLEDGRFWAWEGVGCCPGTCTHVWHYAQALGRIFPEIERNLREQTDFAVIDKQSGKIDFRAGLANRDAADGQAGIIMRAYRDHQMSKDDEYLKKNWEHIRLALSYLIAMDKEDGEANGMIFGEQHNTLDAEWYGNIPVITGLYLSALACGYEMAKEMNDDAFAKTCRTILEKGQQNIEKLFNQAYGYFVQNEDPKHDKAIGIGNGCYIDQVFGQSWAFQVGLGRLFNGEMNRKSLRALWKHNFVPDMGPYRSSLPVNLAGRPYALDGEAGLVMCTWPNGGRKEDWEKHWQYGYFNECMSGFEYQVASHMMWEGGDLIDKSLVLTRSIHDRYHPLRRNPYNEIECSDHYARAMASYGVFLAACGFEYHGPKGAIGFDPKLQPENFRAAFVTAEGWGSFSQTREEGVQRNSLLLTYGKLKLNKISLGIEKQQDKKAVKLKVNGKQEKIRTEISGGKINLVFSEVHLVKGDEVEIVINSKRKK